MDGVKQLRLGDCCLISKDSNKAKALQGKPTGKAEMNMCKFEIWPRKYANFV